MRFSDLFGITLTPADDWFDPILTVDTRLFIDPFLIYKQEFGKFVGAHEEIISLFNTVYKLISLSRGNKNSIYYKKAIRILIAHEVEELCLGYTKKSTRGSGAGIGLTSAVAEAVWEAIEMGLEEISHFEEVAIIRGGIGADRISDMTANLIRKRLVDYTTMICRRHNLPMESILYRDGKFNLEEEEWQPITAKLPRNPYNNKPILLIPKKYLNRLPTINHDDFWDYCYTTENELIRNEVNYDIGTKVKKHEIIRIARQQLQLFLQYILKIEKRTAKSYDFEKDPNGLVQWYEAAQIFVSKHPYDFSFSTHKEFTNVISEIVTRFGNYVENQRGWRLLWNDDGSSRQESAAQDLFLGIVSHYCRANDVDLTREADIGRGSVDFKVSQGQTFRALLELKLAKNTNFGMA